MRRIADIVMAWAAALLVPLCAAAHETAAPLELEIDVWSAHALADEDAARQGRAALPFTPEQIEALGRILRETQEATARGAGEPPNGRVRRVRIDGPGGVAIPEIALRRGYVTAISFADSTGAPWPIEEALVDSRFLPPDGPAEGGEGDRASGRHLLYLAPSAAYLAGNAVVKLTGLADPVVLNLRGTGADADFRVEVRLGLPGPDADPGALAQPVGFHAGDPVLLGLLGGVVPPGAERLAVDGGWAGDRAWRRRGELLLLTRAHLLSPGPLAAERGPDGRWVYRLADTPLVLVSADGRERRVSFSQTGNELLWPEDDDEN
ncbi:MAG: hypothetical protein OXO52_17345 [Rhodospirillales bacterium]|nr:hypothetical protein [Rhodospirillales bacterium]MDE0378497.1 hypothetical protein [Rhodospirillales bacterium]